MNIAISVITFSCLEINLNIQNIRSFWMIKDFTECQIFNEKMKLFPLARALNDRKDKRIRESIPILFACEYKGNTPEPWMQPVTCAGSRQDNTALTAAAACHFPHWFSSTSQVSEEFCTRINRELDCVKQEEYVRNNENIEVKSF